MKIRGEQAYSYCANKGAAATYTNTKSIKYTAKKAVYFLYASIFSIMLTVCVGTEVQAAKYTYDSQGRVIKVEADDGSITEYTYDKNGNMQSAVTDVKGAVNPSGGGEGKKDGPDTPPDPKDKKDQKQDEKNEGGSSNKPSGPDGEKENNNQNPEKKEEPATEENMITFEKGKITYQLDTEKKEAVFDGVTKKKQKKVTVPSYVKYNGEKYKVTSVDKKAFYKNTSIQKVVIGKNVTEIGEQAFYGCKKLKKIDVKSRKLERIGKRAFYGIAKDATMYCPKPDKKSKKKVSYTKQYRKLLKKSGCGKVKVK